MSVAYPPTMIQFALLALLRQGPDYGYRLRHRFDREIGPAWCLNVGQVYQSLQTLEVKGLVREATGASGAPEERGPRRNRRVYAITDKGERTLERWLRRAPTRPRPLRDDLLLRLLAAARGGGTSTRQVLAGSERAHRDRLTRALADRRRAAEGGTGLGCLGLEAEIAHLETHLAWLELCRRVLLEDAPTEAAAGPPVDPRPPTRAIPADRGAAADPGGARRSVALRDRA